MALTTITDAYNHFETLHGTETPLRTSDELRSLIHACDLRYEDIDDRFWNAAFDSGWALADEPYGVKYGNALYRFDHHGEVEDENDV